VNWKRNCEWGRWMGNGKQWTFQKSVKLIMQVLKPTIVVQVEAPHGSVKAQPTIVVQAKLVMEV
jgi:hypothetical protein